MKPVSALKLSEKAERTAVQMELDSSMKLEYDSVFEYLNILSKEQWNGI